MNVTSVAGATVPLKYTLVEYDQHDLISRILAFFSLYPIGVLIFYFSWFLVTREIEPVIIAGGQVLNDVVNTVLKSILRQARPEDMGFGYGMPSAHAQFMGFYAAYFLLKQRMYGVSVLKSAVVIVSSLLVAWSRCYLNYHSWEQVLVGLLAGSLFGAAFLIVVNVAREVGLIDWILTWRIVGLFECKDTDAEVDFHREREEWLSRKSEKKTQ